MANYEFAVASKDTFKVKNAEEVVNVFQGLGFEETYQCNDGTIFIGGYDQTLGDDMVVYVDVKTGKAVAIDRGFEELFSVDSGDEVDNPKDFEDETKYKAMDSFEYLQEQLLDGEVAGIVEAGSEKLRFVGACLVVVTKKGIEWRNTSQMIEEIANNMLEKNNEETNC
jgi:hypothetical protein